MLRFFFRRHLFAFFVLLPATRAAGLCALPWLLLVFISFGQAGLIAGKNMPVQAISATAAYLYLVVSAVWHYLLAGRRSVWLLIR